MKCVCGYEIMDDIKSLQPKFIHLGSVTGASENGSEFYDKYACPKCGTVKLSINGWS